MGMIGEKIKKYRHEKGITLTELAERSNVSKSYLNSLERNIKDNPSINLIKRIAKELNIDIANILDDEDLYKRSSNEEYDWNHFIEEAKKAGIETIHLSEYKELIEFIKWKKEQKSKEQ